MAFAPELDPRDSGQGSRDVHRGGRQPPDDDHLHPGTGGGCSSPDRSPSGCGLPVLFANFAEAMAEGRGKAQADTLRKTRTETVANRVTSGNVLKRCRRPPQERRGDGARREFIPADGEIIEGVASVDESAITGESAPVIRESGGIGLRSPVARG